MRDAVRFAIGDTLYMVGSDTDALYTVETTGTNAGTATQMGTLAPGFGVGEGEPRGLAAIGNTLYMTAADPSNALFSAEPIMP